MIYNPVLLTVQHYKLTSREFHIISIDKSLMIGHHFTALLTSRGFRIISIDKSLKIERHFTALIRRNPREVSFSIPPAGFIFFR